MGWATRTPSIVDRIASSTGSRIPFSVEFSPPRDADAEARLWRAVRTFERLGPAFVSMTYGAGGSTRDRTGACHRRTCRRDDPAAGCSPDCCLTQHRRASRHGRCLRRSCGSATSSYCAAIRPAIRSASGRSIPKASSTPRNSCGWSVTWATSTSASHRSPRGHYSRSGLGIRHTKYLVSKLRAGAEYSITQMFFDVEDYLRLRDRVSAYDAEQGAKPIIPEIMPVTSLRSVRRMLELSGSSLPPRSRASIRRRGRKRSGREPCSGPRTRHRSGHRDG